MSMEQNCLRRQEEKFGKISMVHCVALFSIRESVSTVIGIDLTGGIG